jgi:hypothetical protein
MQIARLWLTQTVERKLYIHADCTLVPNYQNLILSPHTIIPLLLTATTTTTTFYTQYTKNGLLPCYFSDFSPSSILFSTPQILFTYTTRPLFRRDIENCSRVFYSVLLLHCTFSPCVYVCVCVFMCTATDLPFTLRRLLLQSLIVPPAHLVLCTKNCLLLYHLK